MLAMFDEITGEPASMWAGSIVGYGHSHYVYDSGREGDTFVVGFSPRSSATSLYGLLGGPDEEEQLARLGPHKSGKGCLYVTRLDRIDARALRDMVASAWDRRAADAGRLDRRPERRPGRSPTRPRPHPAVAVSRAASA
ncbi:DUF1801 domain-containing protein [Dietzia kunjamensis]|uniref:DUF1801 domain-containing protein n=1 Tax=Dietzia kunjamensis TaxID=322509 RepID=UPI0023ED4887|nr:DUF1801 domain-containing protein [Dietzia kunjamensis]